jgi:putative sugar O-methyltransferase
MSQLGQPSRFWTELGASHSQDLEQHGFANAKRRQALRYFTWSWRVAALFQSVQMRFLLTHTSPLTWMRCAAAPVDLSDAAWIDVPWTRRDRWLYVFAVRLLWQYTRSRDRFGVLALEEPRLGNPFPVWWRGRLISQDLANGALEAEAIGRALGNRTPHSILEVGAGYGRTAYVLLRLFPDARYTIVDIEPAISISRWYLSQLFAPERLRFLTPDEAASLADGEIDLGVSISSLHEMTPEQVADYLRLYDRLAAGGVVYLKQWISWHNPADRVTMRFADYPVPARWRRLFNERASVQTNFGQAAWQIPANTP